MDPFAKTSKLARTPVKNDPPDRKTAEPEEEEPPQESEPIEIEESFEHEEEWQKQRPKGAKRKNLSITPEKEQKDTKQRKEEKQRTGIEGKLADVANLAADLEDMANVRYGKTKTEIKINSEKLRTKLEELLEVWVTHNNAQKQHREILLSELNAHKKENKELKEQIEILENLGKRIDNEKLENLLANINNIEDVQKLVSLKWPEKALKQTKTTTKSILSQATTRIIIANEKNPKDAEILTRLGAMYPSFGKVIKKAEAGKALKLKIRENIVGEEGEEDAEQPETQQIIVVKTADSTDKEIIANTKNACKQLTEEAGATLAYITQDTDVSSAMKIIECCIYKQNLKIEVCAKGRGLKKRTSEAKENLKTMIVKNEVGKTYAETLKSIKTVIKPEEEGVTVRKIARTKDGNVVIKLREETPGASEAMTSAINRETKSNAEIKKEHKIQILIHDLDGITEAKEIEDAIREETGETGELLISDPSPSKNGAWTARVILPRKTGDRLMLGRTIKIGWTNCRVTEKIKIPICYNCLKLGHLGSACQEKRVEFKRCYKCSSHKHEAGTCDSEPRCNECNKTGHIVNSFECPKYRQMIHDRLAKSKSRINALNEN